MRVRVEDLMTRDPIRVSEHATVADAARLMRDFDIGDVLVTRYGKLAGVVTDRDITVRAIAADLDPRITPLARIVSAEPVCVQVGDEPGYAMALMSAHALRRLPVCDGDRVVGIVSLGDLTDPTELGTALLDISTAPANH